MELAHPLSDLRFLCRTRSCFREGFTPPTLVVFATTAGETYSVRILARGALIPAILVSDNPRLPLTDTIEARSSTGFDTRRRGYVTLLWTDGGVLSAPLVAGTVYYAIPLTDSTFQVAVAPGTGIPIDLTTDGVSNGGPDRSAADSISSSIITRSCRRLLACARAAVAGASTGDGRCCIVATLSGKESANPLGVDLRARCATTEAKREGTARALGNRVSLRATQPMTTQPANLSVVLLTVTSEYRAAALPGQHEPQRQRRHLKSLSQFAIDLRRLPRVVAIKVTEWPRRSVLTELANRSLRRERDTVRAGVEAWREGATCDPAQVWRHSRGAYQIRRHRHEAARSARRAVRQVSG